MRRDAPTTAVRSARLVQPGRTKLQVKVMILAETKSLLIASPGVLEHLMGAFEVNRDVVTVRLL
jgi:hypothetical protein